MCGGVPGRGLGPGHPGQRRDPAQVVGDQRVPGGELDHDHHRVGAAALEPGLDRLEQLARLRGAGERLQARVLQPGVAEGHGQQDQHGRDQHHDHRGEALDQPRQPVEQPTVGGVRGPGPDAAAPQAEQGRDQGDRGHHGHQHDPDPAPGQRAQERLGEHQQPAQGGGHGQPGEGDRAAGRGQGPLDRPGQLQAAAPLLAEAADHQQRVVHGQAEAEHGDDVDRVGRDVGELAHPEQDEQRPGHGHGRHQQRGDRGHDPPEDQEQQDQHDRQGQGLAPLQVLLGLLLEFLPGPFLPADHDPGGVDGPQPLADLLHRPGRRRARAGRAPARPGPAPPARPGRRAPAPARPLIQGPVTRPTPGVASRSSTASATSARKAGSSAGRPSISPVIPDPPPPTRPSRSETSTDSASSRRPLPVPRRPNTCPPTPSPTPRSSTQASTTGTRRR